MSDSEVASYFEALWSGDQTASSKLLEGNLPWVVQLVTPLAECSDIPLADLLDAGTTGLASAIENHSNVGLSFQPDAELQGGYAIWWVQMQIMRLANERGYEYYASTNEISPTTDE